MRNNKVYAHLHYSICKGLCIQVTNIWYAHTPTQTSMWTWRCDSATESRVTHR